MLNRKALGLISLMRGDKQREMGGGGREADEKKQRDREEEGEGGRREAIGAAEIVARTQ